MSKPLARPRGNRKRLLGPGQLKRRASLAAEVDLRLSATYGPLPPPQPGDPLRGLIATILSQHTSDRNTDRAFTSLMQRFGTLEAVRTAPLKEIEQAIRSGGLARVKAPRIKQVLERLYLERGRLDLDFLHELDLADARRYLTGLGGVGPKTAACVLLFDLGLPAIPVDTHVHRVSRRLGLIGPKTNAARAHDELEAVVRSEQAYSFHVNLIRHGRQVCRAQRPRCEVCSLADICSRVGLARQTPRQTLVTLGSKLRTQNSERGTSRRVL